MVGVGVVGVAVGAGVVLAVAVGVVAVAAVLAVGAVRAAGAGVVRRVSGNMAWHEGLQIAVHAPVYMQLCRTTQPLLPPSLPPSPPLLPPPLPPSLPTHPTHSPPPHPSPPAPSTAPGSFGVRVFTTPVREGMVELSSDTLFISARTDFAWYRLVDPLPDYAPFFEQARGDVLLSLRNVHVMSMSW